MNPTTLTLGILLVGILIVIGGVLILRLHAFLALTLAALFVAALTPEAYVASYELRQEAIYEVQAADLKLETLQIPKAEARLGRQGTLWWYRPLRDEGGVRELGSLNCSIDGREVRILEPADLAEGDLLLSTEGRQSARAAASANVATRVTTGFGSTCAKIGILIAMASIIGKCLLDSGAADRVVRSALRVTGEAGAPFAFLVSGFLLGTPVFFDTVFYLMIPLGKALRTRTGRNYLLYVLTIVAGATMAHSLVPPTPGPLLVAGELGVDIGLMMLGGILVGTVTVVCGYLFAAYANGRWELPLRESADLSLAQLEDIANRDESELPPLWLSLAPIVLPVVLIGGYTVVNRLNLNLSASTAQLLATLGDKNIALLIAAAIAMATLVWKLRIRLTELAESTQAALASAGTIILITAAGGAFGRVLQQTGVSTLISDLPAASPAAILTLAFLITTAIRTAQGSATVAMITAVGILAGLAESLPFHPVYLALAIGCGSKPVAWMNDSGFWVITRMSGMTESEGLKYITPMTALMGLVGLLTLILGVTIAPLR